MEHDGQVPDLVKCFLPPTAECCREQGKGWNGHSSDSTAGEKKETNE